MSEEFLTPEGRDYLAGLARGDERALELEELHKASVKTASGMLEIAAEHYAACRRAEFWRAEELAGALAEMAQQLKQAHAMTLGKPS